MHSALTLRYMASHSGVGSKVSMLLALWYGIHRSGYLIDSSFLGRRA